ncbi:hypothetical protein BGZ79_009484 [Entomortierella chlamydospora]|nr:hypothetical protein BGZ79_009484 [Entomortierella chlamydospora]
MKNWGRPSSPAEGLGLPEPGSVLYSGPSKPPKRQANIVIEIPPWIPKKKTHVVRLPRGLRSSGGRIDGRLGENTASQETIVNLSTNDKAQLEWNTYLQGMHERGNGLDPDIKAIWSPNSSADSQRGTTRRYSDHDKVEGYSDATDGISEGDTIFPISPCSHCSDDDASEQATLLRRQPKRYHGSNSSSKSSKRKSLLSRSAPQFELGSTPPITLRFSIPTPPEGMPYVDEYIHSLLAIPVFQPEATVTLEDIVWTEQVMRYDSDLKRFRYSILGVSETMDSDHLLILEEAYRANQVQIDRLRDEDYEFFGAIAEVNPDLVKLYFRWRRSLPDNIGTAATDTIDSTDTPTASLKTVGRERPKQSKDSQSVRNTKVSPVHSGTSRSDKEDDSEVICRKFLPQRHRVVQTSTCITFPVGVERCRGCILKRSDERCLFLNFRYFYIDSPRDEDHRKKYIYGPDFYSDPRMDKELSFNKTNLGIEESNYILAHIYTFARDLFEVEAQHVLHASVITDDATMNKGRVDYVRRPSNGRRFCDHCKISNVSGYWMCCVCSREFCMDCMEKLSETTMCTKRRLHKKRQFVPCGRFHLSTLQSGIKSLKARTRLIPKSLVEDAKKALIGLDREQKSKGAGDKLKYRSAFTTEAEKVTREIFQENWRCREVVVLAGIDKLKRINWSPGFLKQNYGDALGTLWSIEPLARAETTLRRFFELRSAWKLLVGYL